MMQKETEIIKSGSAACAPSKGAAAPAATAAGAPSKGVPVSAAQAGDKGMKREEKRKYFARGFAVGFFGLAVMLVIAFVSGALMMFNAALFPVSDEPRVTNAFISGKLEAASEVTSAKYLYSGIKDYEDGFIPVINRSKFSMYYTATVRAGIENTAEIERQITDDKVILTLPAAQVLDVHIHPDSLRYFDKESPLIHPKDREQVAELLSLAEEDARTADMGELLDLADEQLEKIMRGILEDSIGECKLVIKHKDRASSTAEDAAADANGDSSR